MIQAVSAQRIVLIGIGLLWAGMMVVYLRTEPVFASLLQQHPLLRFAATLSLSVLGPLVLLALRRRIHHIIGPLNLTPATRQRFRRYEIGTYTVFLACAWALAGVRLNLSFHLLLLGLFALANIGLLWWAADAPQKRRWLGADFVVPLFFVSGFAALIYQVLWQRALFATFGINIESVTVIVSVFMFGLGIGALAGGALQKRFPSRLLECFILIELSIGGFGLFSLPLIRQAGEMALQGSAMELIGITYALLAFPTLLMGATLPLLVSHLDQRFRHLGSTVGRLYAYNTFGSALAAFLTVYLLFVIMGQQFTLVVAVCCNLLTAALAWRLRHVMQPDGPVPRSAPMERAAPHERLPWPAACLLSAAIGYASLSLEILWFRIIGFMTASKPQVFGLVLAIFLAGIAAGSLKARQWSESGRPMRRFLQRSLLYLLITAYFSAPLTGFVSALLGKGAGLLIAYISIGMLAYFSGGILPALCQMGIVLPQGRKAGGAVAWIYFFNIAGATAGSLITGFMLLDVFSLQQNMLILCAFLLFPLTALMLNRGEWGHSGTWTAGAILVIAALWMQPTLYSRIIENLYGLPLTAPAFKHIRETRSGIITVEADAKGDIIYGTGIYDGRFNLDPVIDSNLITRAYMLAALHSQPQRILEIGLSGGAWARVFTMYQPLRELISIEINPGYLEIIAHYPEVATILRDPRVDIWIDDGRRWLKRHPDERFDAIVMNTTYYWRSNATNVLSREFLELCKRHLNPGGVIYYNTTGARDNIYTAAHVFRHVVTYQNWVAASNVPFAQTANQKRKNLLAFVDDQGRPVFANPDPHYGKTLESLVQEPLEDIRDAVLAENNLWLITDDNMAPEYKIDSHFLPPTLQDALWSGR